MLTLGLKLACANLYPTHIPVSKSESANEVQSSSLFYCATLSHVLEKSITLVHVSSNEVDIPVPLPYRNLA